tara:strand:- start:255 stop:2435 length:2181 start_codon:yes stop_codon:yes gene_type:complete
MANLFDVYKVFRPGTTILSDDFNSFQSALVGAFQKLGTTRADNLTGVEEPFSVGTPTAATHAVRKDYYESSVDALSAAAVAGELASQVAAADGSATDSANSATASANSATASLGYFQAAQALDTIMPSGTTNSTMRYNGSNWAETDKLQIDSAGVVTATAGLQSTGAGTDSFRAGKLAGETAQGDNGIIISSKGVALNDTTAGHIHIASDEASLDYTNAGGWSATDTVGSFALRGGGGGDGAFPDNPQGNPIFLVLTGQSNAVGIYPETVAGMPQNSEVFDWQSTGQGPTGTFAFAVAAPARVLTPAFNNAAMITGMPGSYAFQGAATTLPRGHIGWSAANYIQKQTGRRVYLLSVAWSGKAISEWASGATVEAELASQISDALTAIQATYPGVTAPDAVIWMQGESDFSRTPSDYVTDWLAFKTLSESKWADVDYTQWLVCQTVQDNPTYWPAFEEIVAQTDMRVKLVSSVGCEAVLDVAWHYKGTGLTQLGIRAGAAAMEGSLLSSNEASSLNWKNGGTTSTVVDDPSNAAGNNAIAFNYDTNNTLTTTAKLASLSNNNTEKLSIDVNGVSTVAGLASGYEQSILDPIAHKLLVATSEGKQARWSASAPVYAPAKASAAAFNIVGLITIPPSTYGTIDLDFAGKNMSSGVIYWFKLTSTYTPSGSTFAVGTKTVSVIQNPAPSIGGSVSVGNYLGYLAFYANGIANVDIHWLVTGSVTSIPTSP